MQTLTKNTLISWNEIYSLVKIRLVICCCVICLFNNHDYFKWDTHDCKLTCVRNGITWVMYYEDDCLKVGKLDGENVTEIMSFAEEDAREETELFVDMSFINTRLGDYGDTEFYIEVVHTPRGK